MRVVVTGSSRGMGYEIANLFIRAGHEVVGLDRSPSPDMSLVESTYRGTYIHHICDVACPVTLPDIADVDILINNAGVQDSGDDIAINLGGVINCTKKYALDNPHIKSVLNQASVSAHNGAEFPEYVASKGGVLSYSRYTAKHIAKYGATCNSLSFGGVVTSLNQPVLDDSDLWDSIMMMTPLKKWASEKEAAEWVYFLTVVNKSATAQDIIVDNGEMFNHSFVWK